jgi:hypothetical protein
LANNAHRDLFATYMSAVEEDVIAMYQAAFELFAKGPGDRSLGQKRK